MSEGLTLKEWLSIDPNRKASVWFHAGELVVVCPGESLTWRGRGDTLEEAAGCAMKARAKIKGSAR